MTTITYYFLAALITTEKIKAPKPNGGSDAGLIASLLNPVYFWAGVVATIVIVVAGFLYVTSNGNAQQISRAKSAILAAIVGLVIILSAFLITNVVLGAFK